MQISSRGLPMSPQRRRRLNINTSEAQGRAYQLIVEVSPPQSRGTACDSKPYIDRSALGLTPASHSRTPGVLENYLHHLGAEAIITPSVCLLQK